MRTFDSLHEDNELERFFSSLPGFCKSTDDDDILPRLNEDQKESLWTGWIGFLDRTFSSDMPHEPVKNRRAKICADALVPSAFPYIFNSVVSEVQYGPVRSARMAHFIRRWDHGRNQAPMLVQAIVSSIVVTVKSRDNDWFAIVSDELGVGESILRNYATHDLSLAILIHVTCQQFNHFKKSSWPSEIFTKVLRAASKFEVRHSSPELQRGFCALWNHIVGESRRKWDDDLEGLKIARFILRPIYEVYINIHQQTRAPAPQRIRLFFRTGNLADILKNIRSYSLCHRDDHWLRLRVDDDGLHTDIAFARIAALLHFPSTPALAVVTTAPSSSPAMTLAPYRATAAKDNGKL
jgi:hypothetical protein